MNIISLFLKMTKNKNMNLQEQIIRIQEMMGTTTKLPAFQNLINIKIDELKDDCQRMNTEDDEYVSFDACDLMDSNLKVYLKEMKRENNVFIFHVDITYENYFFFDEESFIVELQAKMKEVVGKNKIIVQEYENKYPQQNRQW